MFPEPLLIQIQRALTSLTVTQMTLKRLIALLTVLSPQMLSSPDREPQKAALRAEVARLHMLNYNKIKSNSNQLLRRLLLQMGRVLN